jgi:hypothetical protein
MNRKQQQKGGRNRTQQQQQQKSTNRPSKRLPKSEVFPKGWNQVRQYSPYMNRALSDEGHYVALLKDAFSADARGCRVPGYDILGSVPEACHIPIGYTTSASGTLQTYIRPSPGFTVYVGSGSGSVTSPLVYSTDNSTLMGALTDATLATYGSMYRIVGGGIRVKASASLTTIAGRLTAVPLPLATLHGNQTAITNAGTGVAVNIAEVEGMSSTNNAWQLNLPGTDRKTLFQLSEGYWYLPFRPIGPAAHSWKRMTTHIDPAGSAASMLEGDEYVIGGAVVTSTSTTMQSIDCADWIAWQVRGENLPVSTACLDVEYILHVEFRPNASNTGNAFLPSVARPQAAGIPWETLLERFGSGLAQYIPNSVAEVAKPLLRGMF